MNKEIENLIDDGVSVYEIAEIFSGDHCVQSYGMSNELCHENADCDNCWIKCLQKSLDE